MSVKATVLFDRPQHEIASILVEQIEQSDSLSVVTGFATLGGVDAIGAPIEKRPALLKTLIVGAATYPGFAALDGLLARGVAPQCLHVHLGHTAPTGGRKNPFARFHPMLHSKIYYMEKQDRACAIVGSHNVTSFALGGLNGEAAVMLEGSIDAEEFAAIRNHIHEAERQSVAYEPTMKTAYSWWVREFIEGLRTEIGVPSDWSSVRTILLFVASPEGHRLKLGEQVFFEIPAGIQQIESLKTEVHMYVFDSLPATPSVALSATDKAAAKYVCTTLGVENRQGNLELSADWNIEVSPTPLLRRVAGRTLRPNTQPGLQQVRAEVSSKSIESLEYLFERESSGWDPVFSQEVEALSLGDSLDGPAMREAVVRGANWQLVTALTPRLGTAVEKDAMALKLAAPESGSFVLVSLRRRKRTAGVRGEQ